MRRGPSRCSRMLFASIPIIVRPESGSPRRSLSSTATAGIPNLPRCWPVPTKQPTRAISTAPNYAHAHYVKAEVLGLSNRFDAALATYDSAIALDRNHAAAYVGRARNLNVIGRAADALAPVEKGDTSQSARS